MKRCEKCNREYQDDEYLYCPFCGHLQRMNENDMNAKEYITCSKIGREEYNA